MLKDTTSKRRFYEHIVITGASSGLGAALAREYAASGRVLGLLGRDKTRLEAVATECRRQGATVQTSQIDVTDAQAMDEWLKAFDARYPVDLLIANAGISGGTAGGDESVAAMQQLFATNMGGIWHSTVPLIPSMRTRGGGQIGIVASLAGYRGLPGAPAYSASKAAARVYGEALRGQLATDHIGVSVICPGFVKTPMTDVNDYPMPCLMAADKAARIIYDGLARNRSRIAFPRRMAGLMWFLSSLSPALTDRIFSRLPAKSAAKDSASKHQG